MIIVSELVEQKKKKPIVKIQGVLFKVDDPTKTGRIYSREVVQSAIEKYHEEYISKDKALGESYDVPSDRQSLNVNLKNVTHKITNLEINDYDEVVVSATVLGETPQGQILHQFILGQMLVVEKKSGSILTEIKENIPQLDFTLIGIGKVEEDEDGNFVVQPDMKIVGVDIITVTK